MKTTSKMTLNTVLVTASLVASLAFCQEAKQEVPAQSHGNTLYRIDPARGDDANPAGGVWRTFARLAAVRLAPGDVVEIAPGRHEGTLCLTGEGSAEHPVVVRFKPGIHTIGMEGIMRLPMYVSNSCDAPADPKPIGILIRHARHLRLEGGGVAGTGKTEIIYDGRMVEMFVDQSEEVAVTGLVFDLKRPTVSEFRVLETGPTHAVIQVAEGSDYVVEDGKFKWTGDWNPGTFCVEAVPAERRAVKARFKLPGWESWGPSDARATALEGRKVRLDYGEKDSGLTVGHQYQFRNPRRDSVGLHTARCRNIVFRDCDFYALTNMGFVFQFTENITLQRVNVAPPKGTIRTCPAWADIFQFSNCKGDILVDECRLSGAQDDAINCHGTYLRIVEKQADNRWLLRYMHAQTYGFAPYVPGDELAVMNPNKLREYEKNPRGKVTAVEKKSDEEWLITLAAPAPTCEVGDVVDNITWNANITIRNNTIDMISPGGALLSTRGKVLVEKNVFFPCRKSGVLVEGDAKGWYESSPIRDMTIRDNRFIRNGIKVTSTASGNTAEEPIHENIRILNNRFEEGAGLDIKFVKGLVVEGNRVDGKPLVFQPDSTCSEVGGTDVAGE